MWRNSAPHQLLETAAKGSPSDSAGGFASKSVRVGVGHLVTSTDDRFWHNAEVRTNTA
jgi:hypothetical protein